MATNIFGVDDPSFGTFDDPVEAAAAFQGFAPDAAAFRTPAEDWARLQTGMSPFWQDRAPMQDLGTRMLGRYYLGAPHVSSETMPNPTFADYLTRYSAGPTGPTGRADLATLRERAIQAAQASTFTGGPDAYVAASQNPEELRRRAVYASLFGADAEGQSANQLAVAQMLAMQQVDPTTGVGTGQQYTGRMGDAIRRALQGVQRYRTAQGAPRESFLDWYLNEYHKPTTTV
tara:strand:+ start:70 stop:762 length:693 start_codon:yes stop_codon:yes gene_type:complete